MVKAKTSLGAEGKRKINIKTNQLEKRLPWILIIGGIIGIICSAILTLDELQLLKNASFRPACDINPVVACGSVMQSWQAKLFNFPNPLIGLAAFSSLVTVGAGMLAGAKFKKWFWLGLEAGMALGMIFAYWLLVESIYNIKALCPYCLLTDIVVTVMFWYTTIYILDSKIISTPKRLKKAAEFIRRHHLDILILWFVIIIAVILQQFWYYYGQYF